MTLRPKGIGDHLQNGVVAFVASVLGLLGFGALALHTGGPGNLTLPMLLSVGPVIVCALGAGVSALYIFGTLLVWLVQSTMGARSRFGA